MNDKLVAKLKTNTARITNTTDEEWIELARQLKFEKYERWTQLVARIQVMLVDAGRMTDQEFVAKTSI